MLQSFLLTVALAMGQTDQSQALPARMPSLPSTPVSVQATAQKVSQAAPATPQTPAPPSQRAPVPAKDQPQANGSGNGNGESKTDVEKAADEPYFLMKKLEDTGFGNFLSEKKITISGWTEMSFTASQHGKIYTPILFQNPTNELLLNQNWLTIEKAVDTKSDCLTFGFRTDWILPGSDARYVKQRGLFEGQPNRCQIDPYQFYVEANLPGFAQGLDVKIGRMGVPYGAEVTQGPGNALFSRSYAYYYNPYTHTGIASTLKLSANLSVGAWLTLGNDVWFDPAADGMFVGTIVWTSTDTKTSAAFSNCISSAKFDVDENFSNQDMLNVVINHQVSEKLKYTLDSGFSWERDIPGIGDTNWWWVINYLTYNFTDSVSGTTRLEVFDDTDGFRTGFEGVYTAITAGVTLKPSRSLMIRPELRYDYNSESRPFDDKHGMFTFASDLILKW